MAIKTNLKIRWVISVFLLAVMSGNLRAAGTYSGGDGSEENPYKIADANDMNDIGNHVEDFNKCFVLINDINLAQFTGTQFNIIGSSGTPFTGVFDGNGHTISNFTYTSTGTNYIGLFGYISDANAEVKDLGLVDANVDAGTGDRVGGLVGYNREGTISNCYATGTVTGDSSVGGLVGYNWATISNCYATGTVTGDYFVGGLAGDNDGTISNCYATGTVTGDVYVGGLVGENFVSVSNCYATGNVTVTLDYVGGLVGYNGGTISNCYATGTVTGDDSVGGLVGDNDDTISNCCATGNVTGTSADVGGLVGSNWEGTVSNCYACGGVSGMIDVGGLVGDDNSGTYTACFWDSDVNPDVNGIGNTTDANVMGRTTPEMQTQSTFTDYGWDFVGETVNGTEDIWTIHETVDYPKHVWKLVNFIGWYEIDLLDYAFFANYWADTNCGDANDCDRTDLDFSDAVDWADLKIFCQHWLAGL